MPKVLSDAVLAQLGKTRTEVTKENFPTNFEDVENLVVNAEICQDGENYGKCIGVVEHDVFMGNKSYIFAVKDLSRIKTRYILCRPNHDPKLLNTDIKPHLIRDQHPEFFEKTWPEHLAVPDKDAAMASDSISISGASAKELAASLMMIGDQVGMGASITVEDPTEPPIDVTPLSYTGPITGKRVPLPNPIMAKDPWEPNPFADPLPTSETENIKLDLLAQFKQDFEGLITDLIDAAFEEGVKHARENKDEEAT